MLPPEEGDYINKDGVWIVNPERYEFPPLGKPNLGGREDHVDIEIFLFPLEQEPGQVPGYSQFGQSIRVRVDTGADYSFINQIHSPWTAEALPTEVMRVADGEARMLSYSEVLISLENDHRTARKVKVHWHSKETPAGTPNLFGIKGWLTDYLFTASRDQFNAFRRKHQPAASCS